MSTCHLDSSISIHRGYMLTRPCLRLPAAILPQVWEQVSPRLADRPQLLQWLRTNTRPLAEQKAATAAAPADKVLVA
jgi:hypothetical protein